MRLTLATLLAKAVEDIAQFSEGTVYSYTIVMMSECE